MAVSVELAAATNNTTAARRFAEAHQGRLYIDDRPNAKALPFKALVTWLGDDLQTAREFADVGLYVIARRTIKPGSAGVYGLFPMHKNPRLTHQQADAHWRDQHGPLALVQHAHMTHYEQLSVLLSVDGLTLDGIALCGFANEDDLRKRFFSEPNGAAIIAEDVKKFADTAASPRRLIAKMEHFV